MIEPAEFAKRFTDEINKIKEMVDEMGAKRLVIDSTTAFGMWMGNDAQLRYALFRLADELKEMKCTTILTAETMGERDQMSRFGVEEFITDSVIVLYFMPPQRALFVRKMRGTKHDTTEILYKIEDAGINLYPNERVFEA